MTDNIDNIIQININKLSNSVLIGEFMIGIEPIHEFVKFWLISNYIQTDLDGESQSLLGLFEESYLSDARSMVNTDYDTRNDYDKLVYQYHRMNREKLDEFNRSKQNEKANSERFKGLKVYKYQNKEFKVLKKIKDNLHDQVNASTTYKRLISNTGSFKNITFKDLVDFEIILKNDIEMSDYAYKNIQRYKLEKRMGFQLLKCLATVLEMCLKNGEEANNVLSDLVMLNNLPLINDRQKYALIYPELDEDERFRWRLEVQSLLRFIHYSINLSMEEIKEMSKNEIYDQKTLADFQEIFASKSYENDYKQRKDFSSSTFKTLMKYVDKVNNRGIGTKQLQNEKSGEDESLNMGSPVVKDPNATILNNTDNDSIKAINKEVERSNLDDQVKQNINAILGSWQD